MYYQPIQTTKPAFTWVPYTRRVDPEMETWPRLSGVNPTISGNNIFNDLATLGYNSPPHRVWEATRAARRLLLTQTSAEMRRLFTETVELEVMSALNLDLGGMEDFNYNEFDARAWNLLWEGRQFSRLWKFREGLELLRCRFQLNKRTVEDVAGLSRPDGDDYNLHDNGSEKQTEVEMKKKAALAFRQDQNDLREWREMAQTFDMLQGMIQRTTDSYLQTVSAAEAYSSNAQASLYVAPFCDLIIRQHPVVEMANVFLSDI